MPLGVGRVSLSHRISPRLVKDISPSPCRCQPELLTSSAVASPKGDESRAGYSKRWILRDWAKR